MNNIENNGGPLFVKPFSTEHEINSNLTSEEAFFLNKHLDKYSSICLNNEGKKNKQHLFYFNKYVKKYEHVILIGKSCCDILKIEYKEWDKNEVGWCIPPLSRIMGSSAKIKEFVKVVE
jgi:hypothetical protein